MNSQATTMVKTAILNLLALPASNHTLLLNSQCQARASTLIWNGRLIDSCTPGEQPDAVNADIFCEHLTSEQHDSALNRSIKERQGCSVQRAQQLARPYAEGFSLLKSQCRSKPSAHAPQKVTFLEHNPSYSGAKKLDYIKDFRQFLQSNPQFSREEAALRYLQQHCPSAQLFWVLNAEINMLTDRNTKQLFRHFMSQYLSRKPDFQSYLTEKYQQLADEAAAKIMKKKHCETDTIDSFRQKLQSIADNKDLFAEAVKHLGYSDDPTLLQAIHERLTSQIQNNETMRLDLEDITAQKEFRQQQRKQDLLIQMAAYKRYLERCDIDSPEAIITKEACCQPEHIYALWNKAELPAGTLLRSRSNMQKVIVMTLDVLHPSSKPTPHAPTRVIYKTLGNKGGRVT